MINLRKTDSVADAIKNIIQQEEINPNKRTKDMISGQKPTNQKDDVGPGSDGKSTKVKYHPGPETQKEEAETVEEALKGNQHKIDKNHNNRIDGQDFKILRAQKKPKTLKSMKEEFEEPILDDLINEVLSKDASAGDWIHDFVHSDNPKFAGKSKAKRKEMALAAYYAKQRNEEVEQIEEMDKSQTPPGRDGASTDPNAGPQGTAKAVTAKSFMKKAGSVLHKALTGGSDKDQLDRLRKDMYRKEEVEQIDELSKGTLGSYVKGAARDVGASRKLATDFEHSAKSAKKPSVKDANKRLADKFKATAMKRHAGIGKAVERLTKEESEEISENSPFDWKKPREPEVKGGAGVKKGRAYGGAAQKSKPEQEEPEEKKK